MRSFLYGVIVPSLLFISGCTQQNASSHASLVDKPQTAFTLTDIDHRSTTLTLENDRLHLSRVVQPYVLLHFFSTRADLCRAMLPYLSDLQREQSRRLFVLGIVVPESLETETLRTYMRQNDSSFFISNAPDNATLGRTVAKMLKLGSDYPLPLTVVFAHGKYLTHYEGVTPIEMIRTDLTPLERNTK